MKHALIPLATASLIFTSLAACGPAPTGSSDMAESSIAAEADTDSYDSEAPIAQNVSTDGVSEVSQQTARTQLIKRAHLTLSVESVDESSRQVSNIIQEQQGDLLSLQDLSNRDRILNFELRVPQERLENTLEALSSLGTVSSRTITTEDVSSQLVDLDARIKNARESEKALTEIMSRSGDISDVLDVSRELSQVRQSIEQMSAQQQSLRTQVRFSVITLRIESAIPVTTSQPGFGQQISNTWRSATQSVSDFSTGMIKLFLWLLVYSPYLAVLLGGGILLRSRLHQSRQDQQP